MAGSAYSPNIGRGQCESRKRTWQVKRVELVATSHLGCKGFWRVGESLLFVVDVRQARDSEHLKT